jgi:SAM-dependent methyltransferase
MDIERIHIAVIRKFTRKRRMRWFSRVMMPAHDTTILDVGGLPFDWRYVPEQPHIVLLNRRPPAKFSNDSGQFEVVTGDGRCLNYPDRAFDIAYSNSVIEHVGNWENQARFAREILRVGKRVWVQTPARCFPIEPHYLTPFIHWLPAGARRKLLRNFSVWGWFTRPNREKVAAYVDEIQLLNYAQMSRLFPDCRIYTERFLGWPKAYIAVR